MLHTSDAINLGLITISQCFYLWHFSPVLWTCSCNNTQLATSRWGKKQSFHAVRCSYANSSFANKKQKQSHKNENVLRRFENGVKISVEKFF